MNVPTKVPHMAILLFRTADTPKSDTLTCGRRKQCIKTMQEEAASAHTTSPRELTSMLLGLMSRCTRFSRFKYASAQRIWNVIFASTASGMGPTWATALASEPPSCVSPQHACSDLLAAPVNHIKSYHVLQHYCNASLAIECPVKCYQ